MKDQLKTRAYNFALKVIRFTNSLPKNRSSEIIARQLIRSATSIGANIIEAQGSSSRKDFTNFFHYSLKSANETKYWLALIIDSEPAYRQEGNTLLSEATEVSNILGASLITLKKQEKKRF